MSVEALELRTQIRALINRVKDRGPSYPEEELSYVLERLEKILEEVSADESDPVKKEKEAKENLPSFTYLFHGYGEAKIGGREFPANADNGRRFVYSVYQRLESDYEIKNGLITQTDKIDPKRRWHALEDALGEKGAKAELAKRLREAADLVEVGYPYVFSAVLPPVGGKLVPDVMQEISVTFSYPWGG